MQTSQIPKPHAQKKQISYVHISSWKPDLAGFWTLEAVWNDTIII
jgi:hypothetical protein